MKAEIGIKRIDKKKFEKTDFPCLCVPTEIHGESVKLRWKEAFMVSGLIRGSAQYFQVLKIKPLPKEEGDELFNDKK